MILLMPRFLLLLSISFALAIIPVPEFLSLLRPSWTFILILYIQFFMPSYFNVGAVFIIGICLDVLLATTLGQHAFAILLTTWLAANKVRRFTFFSLAQQMIAIGFLCLIYHLLLVLMDAFLGYHYDFWQSFIQSLITVLLWPWLKVIADMILAPKIASPYS